MLEIKKSSIDKAAMLKLENRLWNTDQYEIPVYVQITYDEEGFIVRFTIYESNPLRQKEHHLEFVHEDSCVEFFANFLPEISDKYINFEVNARGVMNAGFRSNRYECVPLAIEEIQGFNITPEIKEDSWSVTYKIKYDFIKKYYPGFDVEKCRYIKGNFYKCGDCTEMEHYLSYFNIDLEQPNFHCPEFFGEISVKENN